MSEFHDFRIQRLDWQLSDRRLRLALEEPLSQDSVQVEFSDVFGWHLEDVAEGCTIFRLIEIGADQYLADDQRYIESMKNGCYSNVVDVVRSQDARVWSIRSSYGLRGYIVAKDFKELG